MSCWLMAKIVNLSILGLFPKVEAVHHLGTKIVIGSFSTQQLKSQSQSQLQTTKHTHTVLIDLRQN